MFDGARANIWSGPVRREEMIADPGSRQVILEGTGLGRDEVAGDTVLKIGDRQIKELRVQHDSAGDDAVRDGFASGTQRGEAIPKIPRMTATAFQHLARTEQPRSPCGGLR